MAFLSGLWLLCDCHTQSSNHGCAVGHLLCNGPQISGRQTETKQSSSIAAAPSSSSAARKNTMADGGFTNVGSLTAAASAATTGVATSGVSAQTLQPCAALPLLPRMSSFSELVPDGDSTGGTQLCQHNRSAGWSAAPAAGRPIAGAATPHAPAESVGTMSASGPSQWTAPQGGAVTPHSTAASIGTMSASGPPQWMVPFHPSSDWRSPAQALSGNYSNWNADRTVADPALKAEYQRLMKTYDKENSELRK